MARPSGDQRCETLVAQALKLGGDWVQRHPQTNRLEFLKLSLGYAEQFKQAWSLYKI